MLATMGTAACKLSPCLQIVRAEVQKLSPLLDRHFAVIAAGMSCLAMACTYASDGDAIPTAALTSWPTPWP